MFVANLFVILFFAVLTGYSAYTMWKERNLAWIVVVVVYGLVTYAAIDNTVRGLW